MSAFRQMNYWRPAVVGIVAAAALAMPSGLSTAQTDDWQQCIAHQPDQVLAACSAVIDQGGRADAELARAHAIRGDWYRVRNRNDEAIADFQTAEQLDPKSYAAITGIGATLAQKGQLAEALADYERAITRNAQLPYAYLLRGLLRKSQNQLPAAMADFDETI